MNKNFFQEGLAKIEKVGARMSENNLIEFDRKAVLLLVFCLVAFIALTLGKINYASTASWNNFVPEKGKQIIGAPLLGTAKEIRSDEWHVVTPFMLSQANQVPAFPVANPSVGGYNSPLLMSLPVSHFSTLFRPQNWGFFFLDLERAYAFYWNFKIFGLLAGFFLLLMLFTRNNFWLSILGSLWLFFSTYIQWWFSTPSMLPEMLACFSLVFVGLIYLLFSQRWLAIYLGALLMMVFGVNFVLFFYPPFQLVLVYLFAFLLIGYLIKNFHWKEFKKLGGTRAKALILFGLITGGALIWFYLDAKETIAATMNTVYPGKRILTGGGEVVSRIFSGYFDAFWNDKRFSAKMGFEGNFVLLFPLVALALVGKALKNRKFFREDIDKYLLVLYIDLIMLWILIGFPDRISQLTLFNMIHPLRAILGLGVASLILTIMFLSDAKEVQKMFTFRNIIFLIVFFLPIYYLGNYFRESHTNWLFIGALSAAMAFFTLMVLLRRWKLLLVPMLALIILPNFPVNPVNYGLGAINDKELVNFVKLKVALNNQSRWLVYGNSFVANLLKSTGAQVLNGVNFLPLAEKNQLLDPANKFSDVYNRYANIEYKKSDLPDTVYTLDYLDKYTVNIDPCSDKIKQLGVYYIVLPREYPDYFCLRRITPKSISGMQVYTVKN
jgi:hypothetical protein